MFDWLRRFFDWRQQRERCIFQYWDGVRTRSIDPYVAWRKVWQIGDWIRDAKLAVNPLNENGTPVYPIEWVYEAEDNHRKRTREIFGISEWSETTPGLTLEETDALFNEFMIFCDELKKKRKTLPTSSPPSDSTEPASCLDGPGSPSGQESAYASTPIASTGDAHSGS